MSTRRTGLGAKKAESGLVVSQDLLAQEVLVEESTDSLVYKKTDNTLIKIKGGTGATINDTTPSNDSVYSSNKIETKLSDKVNVDGNKVLSDNNYSNSEKSKVTNLPADTNTELQSLLTQIQSKVSQSEFDTLKAQIGLVADVDSTINTLKDIIDSFSGSSEGLNIATELTNRYTKAQVDTLISAIQNNTNSYNKTESDKRYQETFPGMGLSEYNLSKNYRDLIYKFLANGFNKPNKLSQYTSDIRVDNLPTLSPADAKNLINILVGALVGTESNGFLMTDADKKVKSIPGGSKLDYVQGDGTIKNFSDAVLDIIRQGNIINQIVSSGGLKVSSARRAHSVVNETTSSGVLMPWDIAINWDSTVFSYNSTSKLITVTKAGVLWVSAQAWIKSNSRGSFCIYRNGTEIINPVGNEELVGGLQGFETGCAIQVSANDTIGIRTYGSNNSNYSVYQSPNYSFLSMMLIYV